VKDEESKEQSQIAEEEALDVKPEDSI